MMIILNQSNKPPIPTSYSYSLGYSFLGGAFLSSFLG